VASDDTPSTTTIAPSPTTTIAPKPTTTAAPPPTTTAAPAPTTTAAPPPTTTAAPAPTTTAGPPPTTTVAPTPTTTLAPSATTTTAAPSATTTAAPSATTTAAPSATTTAAPGVTTTAASRPTVDSFTGAPKEEDNADHLPDSLQIEAGKTVVLSWQVSNAPDGVELTDPAQSDPQKLDASTSSTEVTPQKEAQDYSLVALSGEQRSEAKTVHVSTHAEGHVYSPHAAVLPPGQPPQVNYFRAVAQGGDAAKASESLTAAPGATVTLAWEVEGDVGKLEIDNDVGDVTSKTATDGDTSGEGTIDVKLPDTGDSLKYTLTITPEDKSQSAVQATVQVTLGGDGWFEVTVSGGEGKKMSVYHEGQLVRSDVALDDKGHARVDGLPAADSYEIEVPECTLALSDEAQAPDGDSVA